jgi:hypothetical protein
MSYTAKICFTKYDPLKGINEYFSGYEYDEFNKNTQSNISPYSFKVDSEFAKQKTKSELKRIGKEKELELLSEAINVISLEMTSAKDKSEQEKKLNFLNHKYKILKNISEEKWEFVVGTILPDLTGKITPSKQKYSNSEIQVIAKILLKIFKHPDIKTHKMIQNNIKEYVNLPIKIFWDYGTILGEKTSEILVNALSYFVILGKADFVSTILQSIDIFTKKKSEASELYKEIIKLGDPKEYERLYNNQNGYNYDDDYTEGNIENAFDELKQRLEDKLDKDNNTKQEQKVFRPRLGLSFIDKLYDHLEKFNKANIEKKKFEINDEFSYIWRFTKKIEGVESVNWVIGCYDAPDGAHPKYSYYIDLYKFLRFVVVDKNFFAKKNIILTAPSLDGLCDSNDISTKQSVSSQKTSCWNGINQSVKNAVNLPVQNLKKDKKDDKNGERTGNSIKLCMTNYAYNNDIDEFYHFVENNNYMSDKNDYHLNDYDENINYDDYENESDSYEYEN